MKKLLCEVFFLEIKCENIYFELMLVEDYFFFDKLLGIFVRIFVGYYIFLNYENGVKECFIYLSVFFFFVRENR